MNKDEARLAVMGAISMALKDPTLQQGFEIICKENATLEKENAKLKELLEACKQERIEALYRNEQYIKENAELKKRVDNLYNSDCWASEHLTKAKDHIKKLLDCLKQDTNDPQTNYYVCQYMDKAEQFLSEVEK